MLRKKKSLKESSQISNSLVETKLFLLVSSIPAMSRHYINININIAITEKSVRAGDGAWLGGQLRGQRYSAMVVRKPAHKHAALFTSTIIISKLLARPNVKLFNVVAAEDLIVKGGRVAGVMTNWAGVSMNHHTQCQCQCQPNMMMISASEKQNALNGS